MTWRQITLADQLEVIAARDQSIWEDGYQEGWRAAMRYIEKLKAGVIENDQDRAGVKL